MDKQMVSIQKDRWFRSYIMTFLINVNKFRSNSYNDNIVLFPFSIYLKNILFITLLDVKQLRIFDTF